MKFSLSFLVLTMHMLQSPCASWPASSLRDVNDKTYALVEFYCAATLIAVCAVSVLNNACVLLSTCWIKRRPLSTTMRISLSLTGADTISSFFLGVSYFINNILNSVAPQDTFDVVYHKSECYRVFPERLTCVKLALEALRLGAVLVTMLHLLALASNHYLGALRPLHSHVRHAYLCVGLAAIWILPEATLFAYFASFEDDGFRAPGNCGYQIAPVSAQQESHRDDALHPGLVPHRLDAGRHLLHARVRQGLPHPPGDAPGQLHPHAAHLLVRQHAHRHQDAGQLLHLHVADEGHQGRPAQHVQRPRAPLLPLPAAVGRPGARRALRRPAHRDHVPPRGGHGLRGRPLHVLALLGAQGQPQRRGSRRPAAGGPRRGHRARAQPRPAAGARAV
ncbi:hypothetical protein FOCC_FOCC002364 [Frankliniella occidentalis]|nr:hypothetical protein FOCC_FOCC002364 [Frankliniella occidentalis]